MSSLYYVCGYFALTGAERSCNINCVVIMDEAKDAGVHLPPDHKHAGKIQYVQEELQAAVELNEQHRIRPDKINTSIIPPRVTEDMKQMSLPQMQQEFPLRTEAYLKSIRDKIRREAHARNGITSEPYMSDDNKERTGIALSVLNNTNAYLEDKAFEVEELQRNLDHLQGQISRNPLDDGKTESRLLMKLRREMKQAEVINTYAQFLEKGGKDALFQLPTGFGKTVLFSRFAEAAGVKTLVVVPSKDLIAQTVEKFREENPEIAIGVHYDAKKTPEDDCQVMVTTYNSWEGETGKEEGALTPEKYGLLVLDEGHRSLTSVKKTAFDRFGHALRQVYTATPEFDRQKNVENILGVTPVYSMSINEAVKQGFLCEVRTGIMPTKTDLSHVRKVVDEYGNEEYDERELAHAIDTESRNRACVEAYLQSPELFGEKGYAFCAGVAHAKKIAALFNEQDVSAEAISGENTEEERKAIWERYKRGETLILCSDKLLMEGTDDPSARVCLNFRPTLSKVVSAQRGGRVLRLDEHDPYKKAYVIDFVDPEGERYSKQQTFGRIIGTPALDHDEVIKPLQRNSFPPDENRKIHVGDQEYILHLEMQDVVELNRAIEGKDVMEQSWVSDAELQQYGSRSKEFLLNLLVKVNWDPTLKRTHTDTEGKTVTEFNQQAIEHACIETLRARLERLPRKPRFSSTIVRGFLKELWLENPQAVMAFVKISDTIQEGKEPPEYLPAYEQHLYFQRLQEYVALHSPRKEKTRTLSVDEKNAFLIAKRKKQEALRNRALGS